MTKFLTFSIGLSLLTGIVCAICSQKQIIMQHTIKQGKILN